jgi:hypothetical protein
MVNESFFPAAFGAISPSFRMVAVAAGRSVTVVVNMTGEPPFPLIGAGVLVAAPEALMIEGAHV